MDKGTVFKVYFPMAKQEERSEPGQAPADDFLKGSETILVVEDDDLVRRTAIRILRDQDYTVLEARSGTEALEICERHSADIDLMITDMVMPKMSGGELTKLITDKYPGVKILFMSGYAKEGIAGQDMLDANPVFLQKPLIPNELARKVREVLDGNGD